MTQSRTTRSPRGHSGATRSASVSRRRGVALEDALLDAAAAELAELGYGRLSMSGVAERAATSRSVLARRWGSRAEMALAVVEASGALSVGEPADTGSLREDLLALLRDYVKRCKKITPDVMLGIFVDSNPDAPPSFDLQKSLLTAALAHTRTIVERAVERDEAASGLPDHVLVMPIELVQARLLVSRKPVGKRYLEQIVDDLFLPLAVMHPIIRHSPKRRPELSRHF
ncbi:MAG: TetR/AcrR family transcriptional regulator C-terminal ligand-binding domain-containing protein [Actinomycetia bacterium]|nr:TetR/AcrR family transcriptional regulator C-terminal ligand-binding domain-containing protein [Actinomycetes bacterium]